MDVGRIFSFNCSALGEFISQLLMFICVKYNLDHRDNIRSIANQINAAARRRTILGLI